MNQDRLRKHYEQFNKEAVIRRRYEELRAIRRLDRPHPFLSEEVLDWLDWLEANQSRGPLECIGFELETAPDESRETCHGTGRST